MQSISITGMYIQALTYKADTPQKCRDAIDSLGNMTACGEQEIDEVIEAQISMFEKIKGMR